VYLVVVPRTGVLVDGNDDLSGLLAEERVGDVPVDVDRTTTHDDDGKDV
jgi:hypothetical protein